MKNLKDLDVQVMNTQELKEVEGGGFPLGLILIGLAFIAGVLSK